MSKQLNIFYQAERERLYEGIRERQEAINEAFNNSLNTSYSISIKDCLEWLKQGKNINDYKPIFKL